MTTTAFTPQPQGRFADPKSCPRTDPRADPRLIAAMAMVGMDQPFPPIQVNRRSPRDAQLQLAAAMEGALEAAVAAVAPTAPVEGVTQSTQIIRGQDGNEITLYISQPTKRAGMLPGIVTLHGGSMVALRAASPAFTRSRAALAALGLVVIGVEFRNGAGVLGNHPFPAGLNDCASAVRWVHANRRELGLSSLIVSGDSGGANLSLATALRITREGEREMIDGVYAMVPYISGLYAETEAERAKVLPSLVEFDGYFLACALLEVQAEVYDPGAAHARDPLCWPYHASVDDLRGLPPHVISVCELDPLRDEGVAYYRKLVRAGVEARGRMVLGVCHDCDQMFRQALPDVHAATVHDLHHFAVSRSQAAGH
jgi:acetyl esterase/lipase